MRGSRIVILALALILLVGCAAVTTPAPPSAPSPTEARASATLVAAQDDATFAERRERMVIDTIEGRGVTDEDVLRALRAVPRHLFVPERDQAHAYGDYPLPIGFGQTISQPYIVAAMTEALGVNASHVVLEIGTGSGYQTAVLSLLAERVDTIETVEILHHRSWNDYGRVVGKGQLPGNRQTIWVQFLRQGKIQLLEGVK